MAYQQGEEEEADGAAPDERRHLASVLALCMCTLTHAYLLISVFPYSGFMAMHLVPGVNEENVGGYAGLIASAFMFGRAFSSYPWGKAADLYGRTIVLRLSLASSAISTLLFGASPTLTCALAARFALGLSNGMPGTAKTLASELAGGIVTLETRGMGLVFSMWGVGFLLSPAVGGWLADPATQYPEAAWVHRIEPIAVRFPFLLPNLVGAACCAVSWVGVSCFIEETLPECKRRELRYIWSDIGRGISGLGLMCYETRGSNDDDNDDIGDFGGGETRPLLSLRNGGYGKCLGERCEDEGTSSSAPCTTGCTCCESRNMREPETSRLVHHRNRLVQPGSLPPDDNDDPLSPSSPSASIASLWSRKRTREHLISYWLYSFVIICIDEAFPLFCMSRVGGLGITEAAIGNILSGSGLIFATLQYLVYSVIVNRWGVYVSLTVGGFVSVALVLLLPFSVLLNADADATADADIAVGSATGSITGSGPDPGRMSMSTYIFLAINLASIRIFSMTFQSSITIATNSTVPAAHRATMNGLSMLGGSVAKGIGPAFAGLLVSFSLSSGIVDPAWGSVLIFGVIGGLGLVVAWYTSCALGPEEETSPI